VFSESAKDRENSVKRFKSLARPPSRDVSLAYVSGQEIPVIAGYGKQERDGDGTP
jgi:hypothetical protein